MSRTEWIWGGIAVAAAFMGMLGVGVALSGAPWIGLVMIGASVICGAVAFDRLDRLGWPP